MLAGGERGGQTGGRVACGELRTRLRTPAGSVVLEPGADGPDRGEDNHGDDARADREARSAASYRMCVTHRNPRAPAPGRPPRARMPVPVIVRSSNECRVQAASGSSARESAQKFVPLRAHATPPAVRPGVCWTPGCCVCGGEAIAGAGCCVRSAWAPGRTPSPCLPHRGRTRGRSTPAGGPAAFWSRSPASTSTRWSSPAGPSKQPPGWPACGSAPSPVAPGQLRPGRGPRGHRARATGSRKGGRGRCR